MGEFTLDYQAQSEHEKKPQTVGPKKLADPLLLALKIEGGTMIRGMDRWSLQSRQGKGTVEFLERMLCCRLTLEF